MTSGWDCGLQEVLDNAGLKGRFAAVNASAVAGVSKPDPRLYALTAEKFGLPPGAVLHVGDDPANDIAAARAAGMRAVLLDRKGTATDGICSLHDLEKIIKA